MGLEISKRILWRLQEGYKDKYKVTLKQLRRAIMEETGVSERTIKEHIKRLVELELIKRESRYMYSFRKDEAV